jgi:hypothetical protein
MVDVPPSTPVTKQVVDDAVATVATEVDSLLHVSPGVNEDSVVLAPLQSVSTPEITPGIATTETVFELRHPLSR